MMAGVQQPGMTGQVKEDIINRFFELGVIVQDGELKIQPLILGKDEFIQPSDTNSNQFPTLSFTYCSIPFIYLIDENIGIDVIAKEEATIHIAGYSLSHVQSQLIFNRDAKIEKVIVHFKNSDSINS